MFSDFLHYRPAVQAIRLWRVVHSSLIAAAGIDGKAEDGDLLFLWERLILEKGSLKKRSRLFICMLASEYDVWRYRWRWVQVLLNGILLLSNIERDRIQIVYVFGIQGVAHVLDPVERAR